MKTRRYELTERRRAIDGRWAEEGSRPWPSGGSIVSLQQGYNRCNDGEAGELRLDIVQALGGYVD